MDIKIFLRFDPLCAALSGACLNLSLTLSNVFILLRIADLVVTARAVEFQRVQLRPLIAVERRKDEWIASALRTRPILFFLRMCTSLAEGMFAVYAFSRLVHDFQADTAAEVFIHHFVRKILFLDEGSHR